MKKVIDQENQKKAGRRKLGYNSRFANEMC